MGAARGGGCVIAVAPAAGAEAVEGLTFSLTLAAMLTFVVSWGLLLGWNNTFGPLLEGLANALKIDAWRIHIDPAAKLRDLDHLVVGALQGAIQSSDTAMGFWWHQTARLQGWIGDEVFKLSRDTYHFGQWLVHTYVPTYVHGLTDVLHGATSTVTKVTHVTETKVVNLTKTVYVTAHDAAVPVARAAAKAVALPVPVTWPWKVVLPKIGRLEREAANDAKRLGRAEAWIGATALAAAMANVLGLRSARCLRSGNIGRAARAFCGLDSLIASALLADLAIMSGTLSLVEFAKKLQRVEPLIATSLAYLVDDIGMARDEVEAIARRSLAVVESLT